MPLFRCFCGKIWDSICQFFKKFDTNVIEDPEDVIDIPVAISVAVTVRFDPSDKPFDVNIRLTKTRKDNLKNEDEGEYSLEPVLPHSFSLSGPKRLRKANLKNEDEGEDSLEFLLTQQPSSSGPKWPRNVNLKNEDEGEDPLGSVLTNSSSLCGPKWPRKSNLKNEDEGEDSLESVLTQQSSLIGSKNPKKAKMKNKDESCSPKCSDSDSTDEENTKAKAATKKLVDRRVSFIDHDLNLNRKVSR